MTVLITLTTAGLDSGPFNLYSDVDGYTTAFETGVSKTALVSGYTSSLVTNGTVTVRVKSTGTCTNYIDIPIGGITTTTSSTSTTTTTSAPAASVTLSTATCRSGNCNDNATCGVRLPVTAYNAPVGYYIEMIVEASAGASITYSQGQGYAVYTEQNALATLEVRFNLYNTFGGTLLATTGTQYLSHQSYWPMLTPCT
jgi:hypothetical protein